MSSGISKILNYEVVKISEHLEGKILAIDVMPLLYKYLYTSNSRDPSTFIQSSNGNYTGHIKGFLTFLTDLARYKITPILCIDSLAPSLKKKTQEERKATRKKAIERYESLIQAGVNLSPAQQKALSSLKLYVGQQELRDLIQVLKPLGLSIYQKPFVEAEKACAGLKKSGLVDAVYSLDRDLILYETCFYAELNFKEDSVKYYDYERTLESLDVKAEDFLLGCIIIGTDYSKGLYGIGAKSVFKRIKDPLFLKRVETEIPNYTSIIDYLREPLDIDGNCMIKELKDPPKFVATLSNLDFSQERILNYVTKLF